MRGNIPGTVYKLYDADGELVYVGRSMNLAGRFSLHKAKTWWTEVQRAEFEHYETYHAASIREQQLIQEFRPPWNKQIPVDALDDEWLRARTDKFLNTMRIKREEKTS